MFQLFISALFGSEWKKEPGRVWMFFAFDDWIDRKKKSLPIGAYRWLYYDEWQLRPLFAGRRYRSLPNGFGCWANEDERERINSIQN